MLRSVNFSNFNNSWFYPGKNILIRIFWYYTNAIIFIIAVTQAGKVSQANTVTNIIALIEK